MVTYTVLFSTCEKSRKLERALQLFDEMQRQGLHPDVFTYTVLISTCEKCRMTERALQLSDEMQRQGLHHDVVTYTVLISSCDSVVLQREPCISLMRCGGMDSFPMWSPRGPCS